MEGGRGGGLMQTENVLLDILRMRGLVDEDERGYDGVGVFSAITLTAVDDQM